MSQQVIVSSILKYQGRASYQPNIKGNPLTEKVVYDNHFVKDNDTSYDWSEGTQGCTIAYSTEASGAMKFTQSGTILDVGEMTHNVIWSCAKNPIFEARVKMSDISTHACAVGFADAAHGVNDEMVAELSSATLVASRATEFVGFILDTDSSARFWYYGAYKLGSEGTPVATTVAGSTSYQNLRVALDTLGSATFYIDGNAVGTLQTAVTVGTLLTPIVTFMARVGAPRIGYLDRTTMWADE